MKLPAIILVIITLGLAFAACRDVNRAPPAKVPDLDTLVKDSNPPVFYSYRRTKDVLAYIDSLRPEQIPAIVAQLDAMPDTSGKIQIQGLLTELWADSDPQGLLAWTQRKDGKPYAYIITKNEAVGLAYGALAVHDPTAALSQAQQLPRGQKSRALRAIAEKIAETYPAQALKMMQDVRGGTGIYEIFSRWAEKNPSQATQTLLQFPDLNMRLTAVNGMAHSLLAKDPQAAVAWLDQLPAGRLRDNARQDIAGSWVNLDPQGALVWIQSLPPSAARNTDLQAVASALGRSDPQAGLTLLLSVPPWGRDKVQEKIVTTWAQDDPKAAGAYVAGLPNYTQKISLTRIIVDELARTDPKAALALARTLPKSQEDEALHNIIGAWAQTDAHGAEAFVESLPEGKLKSDAKAEVITLMAASDITGALKLIEQMEPGNARDDALRSIIFLWSQSDPPAALAYGEALPPGDIRTSFFNNVVSNMFNQDTAAAVEYLKKLPEDETKNQIISNAAAIWVTNDIRFYRKNSGMRG
jgi:hypothetical protein